MSCFIGVKFNGTFRNYQQRVLDNCKKYYKNNKIHIVAAPGSGKTILGLELIARLGSPCIVLSPTNTIKFQWGQRFEDFFLPMGKTKDDYISYDLNNVKPLTSVTYQALHSAIDKIGYNDEDAGRFDYSQIDMFKLIKDYGIKTICVDEAHHLQNEWQKALEKFISGLDKDIKIIALTATPPYDASKEEWERYINICGEIDEEIFVTELVKEKNLCPHQDYIYINYPTEEETAEFTTYKKNINIALQEIKMLPFMLNYINNVNEIFSNDLEIKLIHRRDYLDLLVLLKALGAIVSKQTISNFSRQKSLGLCTESVAENALDFLLKTVLKGQESKTVKDILKKYGLIQRNKICLELNDNLKQKLVSSMGKLQSISKIVECEYNALNYNLRMLVLTDYIKYQSIANIGTNKSFNNISVVSIFETIRRGFKNIKIGALSGGLVILPIDLKEDIIKELNFDTKKLTIKVLNKTDYAEYNFKVSNKEKVKIVGELFAKGKINILIGTKSLLGEGWDSPCINSLILASFVGSFMLSNQMRGRAIRVDKNNPQKTANIWHLVTLEPNYASSNVLFNDTQRLAKDSADYSTLCRRFNCFVAPKYNGKGIESGIERISNLKPAYTKQLAEEVNADMCDRASNRQYLFNAWELENVETGMHISTFIPKDRKLCMQNIKNWFIAVMWFIIFDVSLFTIINAFKSGVSSAVMCLLFMLAVAIGALASFMEIKSLFKLINHITFARSCKSFAVSIYKTLVIKKKISKYAHLKLKLDKAQGGVNVTLVTQNMHEQNVFCEALTQFYSVIEQPRYIIVKKNICGTNEKLSFVCPDAFGAKKQDVDLFCKNLKEHFGKTIYLYTHNNKIELENCKRKSYITYQSTPIKSKMTTDL